MGNRCHEGLCAIAPHTDLLARQRPAEAKVSGVSSQKVLSTLPLGHSTVILLGLNDGTIFPKSQFDKSVSISAMSRAALDRALLR